MWVSRIIEKRVLGFNHLDMNLRIVLVNLSRTCWWCWVLIACRWWALI